MRPSEASTAAVIHRLHRGMRLWGSIGGGRDMAVDLGTANTLVFIRGRGIVLFEPSVVAISEETGKVHAVGAEAKRMIGRTPASIRATRPLRHGVIADFEMTEAMLRHFITQAGGSRFTFARVVLCVPSGITDVERRAVDEATGAAGARTVYLIQEPLAAAIGAGLPVGEAVASMVIDVGGGPTEVAVISLGGMVVWDSIRVGGYEVEDAIVDHVKNMHKLLIGQETAEAAKIEIGSVSPDDDGGETTVAGRDLVTGLLRRGTVSGADVRRALDGPVGRIVAAVKDTLERTPPELAADLGVRGIVLAGGGSLLRGIDEKLRSEVGLPVQLAESPLTCVVEGAGRSLDELETLDRAAKAQRPRPDGRRAARRGGEGTARGARPPLDPRQAAEQAFDRRRSCRHRRRQKAGESLRLLLVQRHRRLRDAVGAPDAEADVRLLRQVARDAERLPPVARVSAEELDELAALGRSAPGTEAVGRLDPSAALATDAHAASSHPKG